jgi:tRNA pseudouridine55 synthase
LIDWQAGFTMLVDKPLHWTSFDAVNKLRWNLRQVLKVKNIKVGHAGTLDPLATGLLVICTGKHTKAIEGFTVADKSYTGTFLLGKTTPSYDLETAYDQEFVIKHITEALMEEVRMTFMGIQQQTPPIFSAKQIEGQRAYDLARAGKEVIMRSNEINITHFTIDTSRFPEIDFAVTASKGTYIRSLASDFGKKLNSGATLISLRRTASGDFKIENSKSVDEWIEIIRSVENSELLEK